LLKRAAVGDYKSLLRACVYRELSQASGRYERPGAAHAEGERSRPEWLLLLPLPGPFLADAQYSLGVCYFEGKGVPQDKAQAARLYRQAADHGLAEAQYNLGVCYFTGKSVPQDKVQAARLYRRAADQGNAAAGYDLGVCYEKGEGVPQGGAAVPAGGRPGLRQHAVQPWRLLL
jgi:TPR repeat protein